MAFQLSRVLLKNKVPKRPKSLDPNYTRANQRRFDLEQRRIDHVKWMPNAVEPTPEQARALFRGLLTKAYSELVITDKSLFRRKLREEFEITARQTSGRVRGIMYEKGLWMLMNDLGGIR